MQSQQFDLDVRTILYYIGIASETIGSRWLLRKIKEEEKRQTRDKLSVTNRKHSYLYRAQRHPLVGWAMEAERWRKACLATEQLGLNEAILRLAILGRALEQARNQRGFSRLRNRLKQLAEFTAAAFEAEVAYSYIAKGWAVEFVEEGSGNLLTSRLRRRMEQYSGSSANAETY